MVAAKTLADHGVGIDAWHAAMSLVLKTAPGEHRVEATQAVLGSSYLRLTFAVSAMLTSKTALETCLQGQYVQSLMMCRFLVESWVRIAYLQLQPDAAQSWFEHEDQGPRPVSDERMLKRLRKSEVHKANASAAEVLIERTNKHAHPSPQTVYQELEFAQKRGVLGPTYRNDMAVMCISTAATSCLHIADELPNAVQVDDAYVEELSRIEKAFTSWDSAVGARRKQLQESE